MGDYSDAADLVASVQSQNPRRDQAVPPSRRWTQKQEMTVTVVMDAARYDVCVEARSKLNALVTKFLADVESEVGCYFGSEAFDTASHARIVSTP